MLAREGRFAVGRYRRHMKAIGYLGTLDRSFGAPVTTRNWNTMTAVAAALAGKRPSLDKNRASSRLRSRRRAPRGEAMKKPPPKEDR